MRSNDTGFDEFNQASAKELRLVVKFGYSTPLYLTSHAGITNIPAGAIEGVLRGVSSISQRLNPDEGRSEIGSMSFDAVDVAGAVTAALRSRQDAGEGPNKKTVELYRGGSGMDWSDFRLEQTQQIDGSIGFRNGSYTVQCADIQREMRSDLFDLATTRLAADFDAGATTLQVFDTSDFAACSHVASFGDQPTGSYYYLRIKYKNGFEIIRATGKTATTFTGCVRGLFGTDDVNHVFPVGTDTDSSVEVEEYVYLELPAPAMAYALLTGNIIGGGTIPWSLGISTAFVDQPSFEDIGTDWFDSSDYSLGLILRFQGLEKTDGKQFIEREVCLLAGAFLRVGADGKLYMRRMTGVIGSADYVKEINGSNAIAHGEVRHDLSRIRNTFDIQWSLIDLPGEPEPFFARRDILSDSTSIALHGESKPLALQFRGLHNERHTYTTLINRFDALRDRYAGPPITLSVDLLPRMNDLEVGDIVRAVLPNVRDYSNTGTLDRAFEIEQISINQKTGRVTAELFGSTLKADPIPDLGAGSGAELPDSWYSSAGTEFATAGLTINGSGVMTANGSLTGGTTSRTVFYYLGDFTIGSGVTLTISGNVELRIRGQFQINGTLRASGGQAANTAGFLGVTYGGRGVLDNGPYSKGLLFRDAPRVVGKHNALPVLEIENDAGVLVGIPADMRGSGGGTGGDVEVFSAGWAIDAAGGAGGAGGGSVVSVSRGVGYGVSGETDLSGEDGSAGATSGGLAAGSGGGGAPGCLLHVLDGSAVTFPILVGNVVASYGESPITGGNATTPGKAAATDPVDLGIAAARVAYVPASRVPYPDYTNAGVVSQFDGASSIFVQVFQRAASPPATPTADDGSYDFGTRTLTPPTGWSTTPPAVDGNPLYVSTGIFSIQGTVGIDSTVTWSSVSLYVQDGATGATGDTGATGAAGADGKSVYFATVYKRAAAPPATPTADDGSYDFGTQALTPPTGWATTPPANDGNPLYVSNGIFEIVGTTGIDSTVTWTAPAELVSDGVDGSNGTDGTDGGDGNNVFFASVYLRKATAPSTPLTDDGAYNFATRVLTPPSTGGGSADNWSATPPATDGNPLYVSNGIFEAAVGGTDSTVTWTAPAVLVTDGVDGSNGTDGTDGADGLSVYVATIYRRSSSAPATPTGGSYNFGTQALTPPTDWSQSIPSGADPLYSSTATFSVQGITGTDSSTTWSAPAQLDTGALTIGTVTDTTLSDADTSPGSASVALRVSNDGDIYVKNEAGGSYTSKETWQGNGAVAAYQVMLEDTGAIADTPSGGAVGTWIDCDTADTNRDWVLTTASGTRVFYGRLRFRNKSTGAPLIDAVVDFDVDVS